LCLFAAKYWIREKPWLKKLARAYSDCGGQRGIIGLRDASPQYAERA
jgi:hypothetical protein